MQSALKNILLPNFFEILNIIKYLSNHSQIVEPNPKINCQMSRYGGDERKVGIVIVNFQLLRIVTIEVLHSVLCYL